VRVSHNNAQLPHICRAHLLVREWLASGGNQPCYGLLNRALCTILALRDVPLDVDSCQGAYVPLGGLFRAVDFVRVLRSWPIRGLRSFHRWLYRCKFLRNFSH
jgi:hypothetical protein